MNRLLLSIAIGLLFASCAGSKAIRATEVPANFTLKLERTICFGRCPAYNLTINSAGEIAYEALRFAPDSSKVHSRLSKTKLKTVVLLLKQADLPQYEDRYDAEVSDLPATTLDCSMDEMSKSIFMRYHVPGKLDSLVTEIESFVFKGQVGS